MVDFIEHFPEEERRLLTEKYNKNLSQKEKKIFSYVIDEIERTTYWETRRELLNGLKRELNRSGPDGLVKNLLYRINKPKPKVKKR